MSSSRCRCRASRSTLPLQAPPIKVAATAALAHILFGSSPPPFTNSPYILSISDTYKDRNSRRSMGSCVSRPGAAAESVSVSVHALTARVVDLDGSMAQFAAPVTAYEALAATADGAAPPRFLCCSDALDFDAPITAVAAHDALRPGQLYFVLPTSMLGRPLSAQDMAALAVKACAALGTAPVVVGSVPSSLDRSEASHRQPRWQSTGRVAPLVVVSAGADAQGEWKSHPVRGGEYKDARGGGGETVGKARNGIGYKGVVARDLAATQRLSVIVEAASE